ncbi:LacI family DNA-binding transcriptional regulator [Amphibiibacter pelophylacis]|uniref:LacI family DNA-binding transcriptional regulator n=1 Tax=Amphibiibacter pelophylacis TaxID=1799477 RepID=A0ACC6NY55_9BURK
MNKPHSAEPTMADVAREAGVGVATVDRVINRRAPVRPDTAQRVLAAAEAVGFRRAGLIRRRLGEQARPLTLGFVLQSAHSPFYRALGAALRAAVRGLPKPGAQPVLSFLDDLTPRRVAQRLAELGQICDAVAVVAADHPQITQAVEAVSARGVPVFALVSDLTAPSLAGYVGVDNRKVGQTAAWTMSRLCRQGKLGLILGSHRYLCQEQCEVSFRSWLRESAPGFQVLESLVSLEDVGLARATTQELLHLHPDLVGVYVAGGGVEGVIDALREAARPDLIVVCHDLTEVTRQAMLDGCVTVLLSHPCEWMSTRLCEAMAAAVCAPQADSRLQAALPFLVHTLANV